MAAGRSRLPEGRVGLRCTLGDAADHRACLGWVGLFDIFYAAIDGIVQPGGRWSWVEDADGLPTFLLGAFLLESLLRNDRLE